MLKVKLHETEKEKQILEEISKLQLAEAKEINQKENLALSAKLDEINSLKDEYLGELKKKTSEYEVLLNVHKELNQTLKKAEEVRLGKILIIWIINALC